MKRNVFGAIIVAGGLALWTSVAGFADFTPVSAKGARATRAASGGLTPPTALSCWGRHHRGQGSQCRDHGRPRRDYGRGERQYRRVGHQEGRRRRREGCEG